MVCFEKTSNILTDTFLMAHMLQRKTKFAIVKECMSDSVTNYNYVGDTKICVSIKKTNANKINAH